MASENELERVRAALDRLPAMAASPKVVGTSFDFGTDESGDPAIYVLVFLDESTRDEDWVSSKLDPIAESIRQALAGASIGRWPYVRFAKRSDLKAAG